MNGYYFIWLVKISQTVTDVDRKTFSNCNAKFIQRNFKA